MAQECDYKNGPSAYMGFTRIKKKMGWPSENASRETGTTGGKPGADDANLGDDAPTPKKRRVNKKEKSGSNKAIKKDKIVSGDEKNGEAGDDEGPIKKRQKRNPVKTEEVADGEETVQG